MDNRRGWKQCLHTLILVGLAIATVVIYVQSMLRRREQYLLPIDNEAESSNTKESSRKLRISRGPKPAWRSLAASIWWNGKIPQSFMTTGLVGLFLLTQIGLMVLLIQIADLLRIQSITQSEVGLTSTPQSIIIQAATATQIPPPTAVPPTPTPTSTRLVVFVPTPMFTPTPRPRPSRTPTITQVVPELMDASRLSPGAILFRWAWSRPLRVDEYFVVQFWPRNRPNEKQGKVWTHESTYTLTIDNGAYPEGDYYWSIAVIRDLPPPGSVGGTWELIVESPPKLIQLPNVRSGIP